MNFYTGQSGNQLYIGHGPFSSALYPLLAYDRISNRLDLENSDESSDSELDWSNMGTLSQEQKNLISKQFKRKMTTKCIFN